MARDTTHSLQPNTDHDGTSRRLAILACKGSIREVLQPRLEDAFNRTDGDVKTSRGYRLWSGLNRASQDRMWKTLAIQIDADEDRVNATAKKAIQTTLGSLTLSESSCSPKYMIGRTIHGQPGGYLLQRNRSDIAAGVLYEAGGNIYALGQGIGKRDSKAQRLIAHILELCPDFKPRRVLEMGCSAGAQSADYPAAFPNAECYAIDISPAMLRYAHARTELLNQKVHFVECDAAATGFPDDHFDLIVSHNLFHEVAAAHAPKIAAECQRLLTSDGLCVHQDVPIQEHRLPPFQKFLSDWQTENNDEPFWNDFSSIDLGQLMINVGFEQERVSTDYLQAIDGPIPWYVVSASA